MKLIKYKQKSVRKHELCLYFKYCQNMMSNTVTNHNLSVRNLLKASKRRTYCLYSISHIFTILISVTPEHPIYF